MFNHILARLDLLGAWLLIELHRQSAGLAASGPRAPYHVAAAREILDTRFDADGHVPPPVPCALCSEKMGFHLPRAAGRTVPRPR
jgi:hypothetical protein